MIFYFMVLFHDKYFSIANLASCLFEQRKIMKWRMITLYSQYFLEREIFEYFQVKKLRFLKQDDYIFMPKIDLNKHEIYLCRL